MEQHKVALIHNIISPYRVPLFECIASHPSIDLSVFYCAKTHKHRKWDIVESKKYNYEVLSGWVLEYSGIIYHINPSIISKIIKGKYDAVILGGNPDFTVHVSFALCKILRIPVIWWSEAIESSETCLGKLIKPITKYIIKNSDAIVVPSTPSFDFHLKHGATSNKIFTGPNIVDNSTIVQKCKDYKLKKDDIKKDKALQGKKIILFVGQLIERKGVEYLIQAFGRIKEENDDFCLILIGDGNSKQKLKSMVAADNIKDVYFKGWVTEEEKIAFYAISDLFVLPTLSDLCPLVINEAMACSLPIVSTEAAGNSKDMVRNGENGHVVSPKNVSQLYESIKAVMINEELRNKMAKSSSAIIENEFSIENTVHGFLSAIKYSVNNKSVSKSEF